ncbi:sulfatase-like hydrolase/transferase [Snodgrassella alvi]|uniref:sulfatase-like hydrolase/transferase n=1 Tax=Snodgrassella alvi TaxID=1196083 RepID=UPI0034E8FA4E
MKLAVHFPVFSKIFFLVKRYFSLRLWCFLIFYLIINNVFFWLAHLITYSQRYDIVLEYVWIIPLLCLRKKWSLVLFTITYICIYIFDILYWIKQFYHYDNLSEFVDLLYFIPQAPKLYWLFLGITLGNLILSLFLILKYLVRLASTQMIVPLSVLYLLFAICFYDYRGANLSDRYQTVGWWGSYYETIQNLKFNTQFFWRGTLKPEFYDWPHGGVLQKQIDIQHPPKKILFILNESWGTFVPEHGAINLSVKAPLLNLPNVQLIAQGENPALHSTIMGELRELCDLKAKSSNFKLGPFDKFKKCVPVRLQKQGYTVQAFHGSYAKMYDRKDWYPHMDLQDAHFFPQFSNIKQCHSFPGACDYNIVHDVSAANKSAQGKSFIYWLTLNTHHPYSELDMLGANTYDCHQPLFNGRQEACRNLNLQHQFFQVLADEIKAGGFKDTDIVVVGDHSPPIMLDKYKDSFKPDSVPYIHVRVN